MASCGATGNRSPPPTKALLARFVVFVCYLAVPVSSQFLSPPSFNLAENRRITATATCGEGVSDPELYCKLVGANSNRDINVHLIKGQFCDECDPTDPAKYHPAEYAIDGSERWWQSPPLSRGMQYNQINLTIDLGQLFQVAYVLIKMGNSPRPGVWALERSIDNGESYTPWQYFADTRGDCERYFGEESLKPITKDDDVNCITHFSKVVPLEGGEIVVSLLNDRPSANNFFNSTLLQNFTRATNVRLRLIRTKTLLGHLMSVARQDSTVTRRYFYSIKDISIGGRCVCNGHADVCVFSDPQEPYRLQCQCQHNTCGSKCERCCDGYIQKKWRPASYSDSFTCEPCNCFNHSTECIYDEEVDRLGQSRDIFGQYEGGGVCQNCQHNTMGINCHECVPGYYRPAGKNLDDADVCQRCRCDYFYSTGNCADGTGQCECRPEFLPPFCNECNDGYYDYPNCKPCDCDRNGTQGGICEVGGGQCPCKENYDGLNCNRCAPGYYNFPDCLPCNCSYPGSLDSVCNAEDGRCECQNNFGGRACERCKHGYFNFPDCEFCNCDPRGTEDDICDKDSGECLCLTGYSSERCDTSAPGFWGYPLVQSCDCHEKGSSSSVCDAQGNCVCLTGFSGRSCDQCSPGYFNFPDCEPCKCDQSGSIGISCDADGKCQCRSNFDGVHCDRCREGYYIFPHCEECNCNPAGVPSDFAGCGESPKGELCLCKERVSGRICDRCKALFWNLRADNVLGCEDCECYAPGTIGGIAVCDSVHGQCFCKPGVASRRCNECRDGTFNLLEDNLFGCSDCGCNVGGAVDNVCDKVTGQCRCRSRVTGQRCDEPLKLHYFPTLHQLQYEVEDGRTPENTPIRFAYDEDVFPGYSWRGYAVFSEIQSVILHDVSIVRPSVYRFILNYHNPGSETIVAKLGVIPDDPNDIEQEVEIHFPPTSGPKLMTVVTVPDNFPAHFVMNPGRWTVSFKNEKNLFLDYFVLLPLAYYEGTILTENVTNPCRIGQTNEMCLQYAYTDLEDFEQVWGSAGYFDYNGERRGVDLYDKEEVLAELNTKAMAWITVNQPEIQYDMRIPKSGRYVLILTYFTPMGGTTTNVIVEASTRKGRKTGRVILYDCMYSWPCRQAVTALSGEVGVFPFDSNFVNVIIKGPRLNFWQGEDTTNVGLVGIAAVPYSKWHQDMIRPQPVCTRLHGECLTSGYPHPPETTKVEFESNLEGKMAEELPEGVSNGTVLVYLDNNDPVVDITGQLKSAGDYVFVVHYYQPKYPDGQLDVQITNSKEKEFEMDVLLQNGFFYEGHLPVRHCPSTSGCRSVITHGDGSIVFNILENFVLSIKEPDHKSIWVDYVLVISAQQFSEKILHELPRDRTAEFVTQCGQNHYHIDKRTTNLCKDAAFSLSMDYNNGALSCNCDFLGSVSFECEMFGGQCPCKPNVIGRMCNRCKTGFYGFPDCRPCDCPSTALCDPETGECICPPRVEGDRCERCAPYTYGFDPIIGCEECQCSRLGIRDLQYQCDLTTGQCKCKDNVVGRRCDRCAAGFWSFPFCQLCDCDIRGTEDDICFQEDATCYCKLNVGGRACNSCKPGTYFLEQNNPDGCTSCFCFGKSEACSSSNYYWDQDYEMLGWGTVLIWSSVSIFGTATYTMDRFDQGPSEYGDMIVQDLTELQGGEDGIFYFAAPSEYLGNRIKSYGGKLIYNLLFIRSDNGSALESPDVILEGTSGSVALYYSTEQPQPSVEFTEEIVLNERNFRTPSGAPMTREQFMVTLHDLRGIYIRGHYWSASEEARLSKVTLQTAVTSFYQATREPALSVEQCQCPANYLGSSCEDCAPGYYRAQTGPFGGFCVPCQCNGHADTCDAVTGVCITNFPAFLNINRNCRHNTEGDHCETCAAGYHGDATQATPYDCLICACPLPSITNNFADSCDVTYDGISITCNCREGYIGSRCELCAPGYYGEPEKLGEYCKPCNCSGNIDVRDPYACDDITGVCLACLNNTYGDNCERCAPNFFGDAVVRKDCQSCSCDECGTRNCQHYTGVCECQENVIGETCNQCAPDHWGFASCQGCQPCVCGEASLSTQCDKDTGQCHCADGVAGQRCQQCKPGYWNYTRNGCQECTCRAGFSVGVGCDPRTGQCSCLPGVIGSNCEGCPYRWVLIDGVGCQRCDECVHALLNTTEELRGLIAPVLDEFQTAAHSFFLHQRLGLINATVNELEPQVASLDLSSEDLQPIRDTLQSLYRDAQGLKSQTSLVFDNAGETATDGDHVRKEALKVQEQLAGAFNLARDIINEINRLVIGLETGTGAQIEQAIQEAEQIMAGMNLISFSDDQGKVEIEMEKAQEVFDNMKLLHTPIKNHTDVVDSYSERLSDFRTKVEELEGYIHNAHLETSDANDRIQQNKWFWLESLSKKLEETQRLGRNTRDNNEEGEELVRLAEENLSNATKHYETLLMETERLRAAKSTLRENVDRITAELEEVELPARKAQGNADKLHQTAEELDSLLADTREVAENALAAANAYKNIVTSIEEATIAAEDAKKAATKAFRLSEGITDDGHKSYTQSEDKYTKAEELGMKVEKELRPQLTQAEEDLAHVREDNTRIAEALEDIHLVLDSLELDSISKVAAEDVKIALEAHEQADNALQKIEFIENDLLNHAESARQLMRHVSEGNRAMEFAHNRIRDVEDTVPNMLDLSARLKEKKSDIESKGFDFGDRLANLRSTIQKTRELANKIKVGVDFESETTIELKNPDDLTEYSTSTKMSLFVNTRESNGFLMFLGSPVGTHQKIRRASTDDFMALELDNGYARLTVDLGDGPESIENNKVYISDGQWKKISIDRTGKVMKLSVHREDADGIEVIDSVEEVLPGTQSVFNLDSKASKIFVGGIPPGVEVDNSIHTTSFYGKIEEVRLGNRPLSLWNFMANGTNNIADRGSKERTKLIDLAPPTGLRFDGSGHAALDTRNSYHFTDIFDINFQFKTYVEDGLLYLLYNSRYSFMALEIRGGRLMFQYNLGSGIATFITEKKYNDGEWHRVEAARQNREGILKVDSETVSGASPGPALLFSKIPDIMYFGGFPQEHDIAEVTNEDFEGCIDHVTLSSIAVDLSKNKESVGIVPGCPVKIASLVSFEKTNPGFIRLQRPIGSGLQLVFKFKTSEPNGLIFYASNVDQSNHVSLSIAEGSLILRAAPAGEINTGLFNKYNDSEWHVVVATREDTVMHIDIDDVETYQVDTSIPAGEFNGPVFFGGVSEFYRIDASASAIDTNFIGCIADATINGRIVNFADTEESLGAVLQSCPLADPSSHLYEGSGIGEDTSHEGIIITHEGKEEQESGQWPLRPPTLPPRQPPTQPPHIFTHPVTQPTTTTTTSTTTTTTTPTTTQSPVTTTTYYTTEESILKSSFGPPADTCALPVNPRKDPDNDAEPSLRFDDPEPQALQFGKKPVSRIEGEVLPDNPRSSFKFSFDIRTEASDGIIFYAADIKHKDFIAAYMKDGKVVFGFNPGTGAAVMRSRRSYNDGQWHNIILERKEQNGRLLVDGNVVAEASSKGNSKYIDVKPPYYYGGLNQTAMDFVRVNTEGTDLSFNGCLKSFRMNNKRPGWNRRGISVSVSKCSDYVEPGVFLGGEPRSYIIVRDRFNVGREFTLTMEIKPRVTSGVLISVHGRRDFILLEMRDGSVQFSVDNGNGIIIAKHTPASKFNLCDGNWHEIQAIKTSHVALLVVDGVSTAPVSGRRGATSTDTLSPIFLGSQPHILKRRGNATPDKFVGCIRNLKINKEATSLAYSTFVGNVNAGVCPTI
ncbi:laminin subunit alpha isoform X4 [Oratosquilla oratoria]|uniref:laminin subunit alpha isoform X4 n=1 Tax=Oratosquilla oratoria TaxID=337810 RepID=UPI003F77090C